MPSDTQDMPMTPVKSSNIAAVGTSGRDLLVQFVSGQKTYRYAGAAEHAGEMLTAPSPGGYLFRQIKPRYPATQE